MKSSLRRVHLYFIQTWLIYTIPSNSFFYSISIHNFMFTFNCCASIIVSVRPRVVTEWIVNRTKYNCHWSIRTDSQHDLRHTPTIHHICVLAANICQKKNVIFLASANHTSKKCVIPDLCGEWLNALNPTMTKMTELRRKRRKKNNNNQCLCNRNNDLSSFRYYRNPSNSTGK